jgi:hypothetical protein
MFLEHGAKYGKLTYTGDAISIDERSTAKLLFKCDCGRQAQTAFRNVSLGRSKSCGKCTSRLVKTGDMFGNLEWIGPDACVQPESQKKSIRFVALVGASKKCACSRLWGGAPRLAGYGFMQYVAITHLDGHQLIKSS